MRVRLRSSQLLPIGLLASAGVGVQYVNIVFSSNVRWIMLLSILAMLLLKRQFFVGLRGPTALIVFWFTLYTIFTTFWSDIPLLSGSKSLLQFLTALTYFTAGTYWIRISKTKDALNVLWPLVGLAILAAGAGNLVGGSTFAMGNGVSLYRGLTYNPNYLGLLLVLALPLPLWLSAQNATTKKMRRFAIGLLVFLILMVLQTVSRASILSASIVFFFFFLGRGVSRVAAIFALSILTAAIVPFFAPQLVNDLFFHFIFKGNVDLAILASRDVLFVESLEGARAGGAIGLGHGVSFGFSDYLLGQGSAVYGREKGNVTLAMLEELGWVGLFLFTGILISLIRSVFFTIRGAASREHRTVLLLMLGVVLALLMHAQFEAWLLAPGAAATPVFWTLVGMVSAMSDRIRKDGHFRKAQFRNSTRRAS